MMVSRTLRLLIGFSGVLAAQMTDSPCGQPGPGSVGTISSKPLRCTLPMASGQTAEVIFSGRDRDLKLELLNNAGTVLATVDMRETGPELAVLTTPEPGEYILRLTPLEKRIRATPYTLRVHKRPTEPADEARGIAQTATTQARSLSFTDAKTSQAASLAAFQGAAQLWQQLGDRESEAAALAGAGTALYYLAQHEQATAVFTRALDLLEGPEADWLKAECLNNLGISLWQGGHFQDAIERYSQALVVLRQVGHQRGETAALSNLGIIHREMGEYDKARQYHTQALPISIQVGEPAAEAYVRSNLGVVLSLLGQRAAAIASLTRARQLFHGKTNSVRAEGRTLLHLASLEFASKHYRAASGYIQPALQLIEKSGDQRSLGDATMLRARLLAASGQTHRARAVFLQAAKIYTDAHLAGGEASVSHALGELAYRAKEFGQAEKHLEKALAIRRALGVRDAVAETLYRLAAVRRATGDLDAARKGVQEALLLTEEVRTLVSGSHYRMSYLSSKHDYYGLAIHIDVDLHLRNPLADYDRSAFELSERARTRTLLDTLNANYQTPAVQTLRSRLQSLTNSLRFWSYRLAEQAASGASAERLASTRSRVDEVLAEYRSLQSDVAANGGSSANPHGPLTSAQIQESLTGSVSLLQYFVGEERSVGWLITRRTLEMAVLPNRATIEKLAHGFYSSVLQPVSAAPASGKAAESLANAILPRRLQPPAGRLLIAPDGVLHQIPMPLLPDAQGTSLLVNHDVTVVPSLSAVIAKRAVRPKSGAVDGMLAVVADPVFDTGDPRVRTVPTVRPGNVPYPRLGYTNREARQVAILVPESNRVVKLGFQARPDLFFNGDITRYRHVHIATHAVLDESYPELSSLVFSLVDQSGRPMDGYLRASDIAGLTVRADLVTLSACGTGLGTRIRGEGPLSLARAFLTAGARMVLVSLWNIPDDSTAELMTAFYQKLFRSPSVSPVVAFRQAQLQVRSKPGRSHPFYWAGWVLTGDWQ